MGKKENKLIATSIHLCFLRQATRPRGQRPAAAREDQGRRLASGRWQSTTIIAPLFCRHRKRAALQCTTCCWRQKWHGRRRRDWDASCTASTWSSMLSSLCEYCKQWFSDSSARGMWEGRSGRGADRAKSQTAIQFLYHKLELWRATCALACGCGPLDDVASPYHREIS